MASDAVCLDCGQPRTSPGAPGICAAWHQPTTLLTEWREQEAERARTRYPFATDEDNRCEAVRRDKGNPFNDGSDWTILYRCGKAKGHDSRHACSDEGAWTVKW